MDEQNIKKGLNIYLYYWTIPAFFIFMAVNLFMKNFKLDIDANPMLSVVSFLFGFILSITFSMILTRYHSLKNNLSVETGKLIMLYSFSKHLGERFHERIKELIDEYTIITLRDYTNYGQGREVFFKFNQSIDLMNSKTDLQKNCVSSFFSELRAWSEVREGLEVLTEKRTEIALKLAIYTLGVILICLLFLNRGDIFTNTLFIVLSTIIVFIFLIIEDYDHLHIGDYAINISNSEELFDMIEKDRYYPENVLNRVNLEKGRMYRIGIFDKKEGKEKIYSIRYSPVFNTRVKALADRVRGR